MKRKLFRPAWWSHVGAILLLVGALRLAVPVAADEPPTNNPPQSRGAVVTWQATERRLPPENFLNKIPYVNRLFKTTKLEELGAETAQFERIGVDFDFTFEGQSPTGNPTQGFGIMIPTFVVNNGDGVLQAECIELCNDANILFPWGLAGVAPSCECQPANRQASCAAPACAAPACVAHEWAVRPAPAKCCESASFTFAVPANQFPCPSGQCRQVILHAAPQTYADPGQAGFLTSHAETAQLFPELMRLAVEHAKLETAVELQAELQQDRDGSRERLIELAVKNAKLEAQLEFANQKLALLERTMAMVHENGMLKARVEMLEKQSLSPREARATGPVYSHPTPVAPVPPSTYPKYEVPQPSLLPSPPSAAPR